MTNLVRNNIAATAALANNNVNIIDVRDNIILYEFKARTVKGRGTIVPASVAFTADKHEARWVKSAYIRGTDESTLEALSNILDIVNAVRSGSDNGCGR